MDTTVGLVIVNSITEPNQKEEERTWLLEPVWSKLHEEGLLTGAGT